ncbi:MAG: tellurium resistance protein TehB, partial [Sulfurovum sp.]|nr:tellurium resistance protein TehB [Sulfurovum sp.]
FKVDALDISSVAITSLQGLKNIEAQEVDFDTHTLEKEKYDIIVCTYFLERKLFSQMIEALRPHGVILMETFVQHPRNGRKPTHLTFRLKEGELKRYFEKRCELIYIEEWWDTDYQGFETLKVSMAAKKIP